MRERLAPKAHPPRAGIRLRRYMYYVYVLRSRGSGKRYIGYATDLRRRVKEHQRGGSEFTSRYDDWVLVYYEAFLDKEDAQREERFLKTGKGRERLKYLFSNTVQ